MTDRKKALTDLLAKVEAGEWFPGLAQLSFGGVQNYSYAAESFIGSIDAAKALHEAVLPGFHYSIDSEGGSVCVFDHLMSNAQLGTDDDPARAWLIAIIKALISMEGAE
jgi:predicted secreted Zn-dependent protease